MSPGTRPPFQRTDALTMRLGYEHSSNRKTIPTTLATKTPWIPGNGRNQRLTDEFAQLKSSLAFGRADILIRLRAASFGGGSATGGADILVCPRAGERGHSWPPNPSRS